MICLPRSVIRYSVTLVACLVMSVAAAADDQAVVKTSEEPIAAEPEEQHALNWVSQLADPDPSVRESARESLSLAGESAWPELSRVFHGTDDFDIRLTIRKIVEHGFMYERLYRFHGFLGIGPNGVDVEMYGYAPLRRVAGASCIQIDRVVTNSAADRAGLKERDLIYAVDNQRFDQNQNEAQARFMELLGGTTPGTKMTFSILRFAPEDDDLQHGLGRSPRLFDVEIALGYRDGPNFPPPPSQLGIAYEKTHREFEEFWAEQFEAGLLTANHRVPQE